MSMLTKAFVVLVTVLSVLTVALFASFAATIGDKKGEIASLQQSLAEQETTTKLAANKLETIVPPLKQKIAALQTENSDLKSQAEQLQGQLAAVQSELNEKTAQGESVTADLKGLTAAYNQTSELLKNVTDELKQRREEAVSNQRQLIERADRIAGQDSQLASLNRQVRRFKERMNAMDAARARAEQRLTMIPVEVREKYINEGQQTNTKVVVTPEVPISGQVTGVSGDQGQQLLEVNVGSSDGVKKNVEFMVYRGTDQGVQLLGSLLIERVEPDSAVGRMTLVQGDVQSGDRVYAGPELAQGNLQ